MWQTKYASVVPKIGSEFSAVQWRLYPLLYVDISRETKSNFGNKIWSHFIIFWYFWNPILHQTPFYIFFNCTAVGSINAETKKTWSHWPLGSAGSAMVRWLLRLGNKCMNIFLSWLNWLVISRFFPRRYYWMSGVEWLKTWASHSISGPQHGCVESTVIERRPYQLGRMANIPPPKFITYETLRYHKLNLRPCGTHWWI